MKKNYRIIKIQLLILIALYWGINPKVTAQNTKPLFEKRTSVSNINISRATKRNLPFKSQAVSNTFRKCITMEADATLRRKYPSMPSRETMENELQRRIKDYKRKQSQSRTQAAVYVIPVIVHVVHNGEAVGSGANITAAQVKSQIDVLNEDFRRKTGTPGHNTNIIGADVEIEFALALRDPQGNTLSEPGIHRIKGIKAKWESSDEIDEVLKPSSQWNPNKYLNMWTVDFDEETTDGLLGYAQFPVLSGLDGLDDRGVATTDGLVMRYNAFGRVGNLMAPYNKGRTTTHEVGHWLGLRHIWGDEEDCTGSDFCQDTPEAGSPNYGCPKGTNSCTDTGNDMIENYMDYTDDACMNIFTIEQKVRMRTVMEKSPRRKELLSSTVHIPITGDQPLASFEASATGACIGTAIDFTDKSTNIPTAWNWYFFDIDSNVLATSTLQNPSYIFNENGSYSVTLIAQNANGKDTVHFSNYLTILSNAVTTIPFSEDFEEENLLTGWTAYNPDKDREWYLTDQVSANNIGSSSIYFDNYSEESDPTGKIDRLVSSEIDLSTNTFAEVTFDVAYAMYDKGYEDTLAIYYSLDCGESFERLWAKGGESLITSLNTIDAFIPETDEWRREKVSLASLNGHSSVYLAIANISGWGNYLYIDNINIHVPAPTAKPITNFNTTQTNVCLGSTIQFNDSTENSPRTWSWTFEGGTPLTSSDQNPVVTYNTPGLYSVTLTTSNTMGENTKNVTDYITVIEKPVFSISANSLSLCEGEELELSVSGGEDYEWFDNRGIIGSGSSITLFPAFTNTYTVKGESNGCPAEGSIEIRVNPAPLKPTIDVSDPDAATFILTSSAASGNQWFLDGDPLEGAVNQEYSGSMPGSYTVVVTENGCVNTSDAVILTSDDDLIGNSELISLYPNPANSNLIVLFKNQHAESSKATLYNSWGQKLSEGKFRRENGVLKALFSVDRYPDGTYFVVVWNGVAHLTKSFIKE